MDVVDRRIVVVDDERIILDLTSLVLRSKGYEVFTAGNGIDGMALIEQELTQLKVV